MNGFRGGIPRPIWNFLGSLSQAILVGIMLVGRSGVATAEKITRGETGSRSAQSHQGARLLMT